jgi:hypothetical protein
MRSDSGSSSTLPNSRLLHRHGAVAQGLRQDRQQQAAEDDAGMWPMPPSTTMHSTMIDSIRPKLSGLTNSWKPANRPPATPPKLAPMAKASSLTLRVLMPQALAAISSSRMATQARPMRESCRRMETKTMSRVSARNR